MIKDFKSKIKNFCFQSVAAIAVFALSMSIVPVAPLLAQSEAELKNKIDTQNEKIKQLDEEIKVYEKQIQTTQSEAKSLENTIKILDTNQKKISTEIKKTETDINKTSLTIEELGSNITDIQTRITNNKEVISRMMRDIYQVEDHTLVETILSNKSIADVFDNYKSSTEVQEKIREVMVVLSGQKLQLEGKKESEEKEKGKLLSLKGELGDQKVILDNNKKEKNGLLSVTKNKEAEYKKVLNEKQTQKEEFERQLFDYESQLKRIIDPNSYEKAGNGVFGWPLDNIFVTQAFGRTIDAKRLYASGSHNGVDFRASRGTPVKSIYSGIVKAVGNTDEQRGCYSYGKWVLIEHPNGLSSLYAHLDLIKVSPGNEVNSGSLIGYSGQTGYATGPHLHLTLYATQGVSVERYSFSKNCQNVSIPIADKDAYLDPMPYFSN